MPTPTQFPVVFSGFATGYCYPADPETFANDLTARLSVQWNVSGVTGLLVQNTTPTSSQRGFGWYNTDTGRTLYWSSGVSSWVARHPSAASGDERRLWMGTTTALETFDGGASGVVGDAAGPMWEVDTAFAGRVFLGVGTLSPSGTVVALDGVGGEDTHVLTVTEMPAHTHDYLKWSPDTATDKPLDGTNNDGGYLTATSTSTGGGSAHQNMPPYRAGYVIRRTARIYYTS